MADDDQHEYLPGKTGRIGAGRSSQDGNFEFEEPKMLWESNLSKASAGSGPKKVNNNTSSSSAPMAIPDWQKIYGTPHHEGQELNNAEFFKMYVDEDGDEGEMIPPHEYIAKKLASSQISSLSVCEGAGRTLKGRDLSRLRNAILTKTGFLE